MIRGLTDLKDCFCAQSGRVQNLSKEARPLLHYLNSHQDFSITTSTGPLDYLLQII